eukprot:CAMPEP_0206447546 /NCGR_PEP_ID=MMETSP0324_2-20121206/16879_1 /ASSEMBLY_ACC=CAM_ASM_000836 /TAXON_ID=2866 /ORGANISM="Crypthecodinium cohnii, Strain Seligo" /LENGTH=911 /DNA_ID=CAMNT_0053916395 /DNA_START=102 /DNA_END=2837 /DNA_ORIENTATION=+
MMLDPSEDVLQISSHPLDSLFKPTSVAVVGATDRPGSVGRTLLKNLISNPFGGAVYPVNPKREHILGITAFKNIAACPKRVDVAVIITPAASVPKLIQECVDNKVQNAIIISAGFREVGHEGEKLEEEIKKIAFGKMRIVGPNCLGIICPSSSLNASFANLMPQAGSVAFISQSGAMITAVLDWSVQQKVGFSAVISIGAMMDMDFSDMIDYLANDQSTKSIVLYMETIGNARRFLSAAREAALTKPIIVIKGGKTEAAAKAAASHTGSLTGSDAVLDAAFKRAGVLRVDSVADLFEMADILSKQPLPKGNRLAILTNAGGPGVLACDALAKNGGVLADLEQTTIDRLDKVLPPAWSHSNPIDVLGDASAAHYAKSLEIIAEDNNCDGFLVILTPQAMTAPTECAEALKKYASIQNKPVLASWMGGPDVMAGAKALTDAGIPCYSYPDGACRTFNYMHEYKANLESNYERIDLQMNLDKMEVGRTEVSKMIQGIRSTGRTLLTEAESKQMLRAYGIPVTACEVCATPEAAGVAAEKIGFPVVVKLNSTTITHKFDVGGVKLNLHNKMDVERAFVDMKESVSRLASADGFEGVTVQPMISVKGFEIILGSSLDPQLGPVVLFGFGGSLVEVFQDSSLGLPPLNANLARQMLMHTKIYKALKGVRGMDSVDMDLLLNIMVRFSVMVVDHPEIVECDINPLICSSEGILSLDSRVVLHEPSKVEFPQPAIRPYPHQYVKEYDLKGTKVTVRPIMHEDEELMMGFYSQAAWPDGCDPESPVHKIPSDQCRLQKVNRSHLIKTCFTDFDRSIVLVAEAMVDGGRVVMAAGRCTKEHMTSDMKFALQVLPHHRQLGLGSIIMRQLIQVAREEGATRLKARVHVENETAHKFLKKNGFTIAPGVVTPTLFHSYYDLTK